MRKKTIDNRIEKSLYSYIDKVSKFEDNVCKVLDGEIDKKELMPIAHELKVQLRHIEDLLKKY